MKKYFSENRGTTMVETLAAFTVLAVVLVILFHIVNFSSNLRMLAVDSAHLNQMFLREIYKNEAAIDPGFVQLTKFSGGGYAEGETAVEFRLELDTEKTDLMRNYRGVDFEVEDLENHPPVFKLNQMGAISYRCVDPIFEEESQYEGLIRPTLMNFVYGGPEPEEETPGP